MADLAAAAWLLPVPDRHVLGKPASAALAAQLRSHLTEGTSIAIHYRNRIGRASTVAATVLVLEGTQPQQAWKLISAARGLSVPDTDAQPDFILNLGAAEWPRKPSARGEHFLAAPHPRDPYLSLCWIEGTLRIG
jgi:hypothetical protein